MGIFNLGLQHEKPIGIDTSIRDMFKNILEGREFSRDKEQYEIKKEGQDHDLTMKREQARHAPDMELFKKMIQEAKANNAEAMEGATLQEKLAHAAHLQKLSEAGIQGYAGSLGSGKRYAPSGLAKLMLEKNEVDEGFLPGSNRSVELSPEDQEEYRNRIDLQMQKMTTDLDARKRSLFAKNLVQSIDSANVDDLTKYSGPQGRAKLSKEIASDMLGKPSEEYLKYKEAQKAVALEAQELRQFLGTSITPEMDKALRNMVDATSSFSSPESAKRQIQKSRGIIKKQLKTYQNALKNKSAYGAEEEEFDPFSQDENYSGENMVTIRNKRTGETKTVSKEQAEMMRGR